MSSITTTVTVHGRRGRDFEEVFGTRTVPVVGWIPKLARLPGFDQPQEIYELDMGWVRESGYRDKLAEFLASRFGLTFEEVAESLDVVGVPILATDCTVMTDAKDWL